MMTKIQIPENVLTAVAEKEKMERREQWYDTLRKMVAGKQAVGKHLLDLTEEMAKMVSDNSDEIKVLPVRNNAGRHEGYFAIFNLCKIEGRERSDYITMEIPAGKKRLFFGYDMWQLKEWVRTSWLRRLRVRKIMIEEAAQ